MKIKLRLRWKEVKGEVLDEMEEKIKRCKEAGCESKISYKFRVGNSIRWNSWWSWGRKLWFNNIEKYAYRFLDEITF
jgi:hypothetical protein